VIGGCCGTTPEYIRDLQQAKASFVKREANKLKRYICSAQKKFAWTARSPSSGSGSTRQATRV